MNLNEDMARLCIKFKHSDNLHCEIKSTYPSSEAYQIMTSIVIGGGLDSLTMVMENGEERVITKEDIIDVWLEGFPEQ